MSNLVIFRAASVEPPIDRSPTRRLTRASTPRRLLTICCATSSPGIRRGQSSSITIAEKPRRGSRSARGSASACSARRPRVTASSGSCCVPRAPRRRCRRSSRRFARGDVPTSIWWTEDLSNAPVLEPDRRNRPSARVRQPSLARCRGRHQEPGTRCSGRSRRSRGRQLAPPGAAATRARSAGIQSAGDRGTPHANSCIAGTSWRSPASWAAGSPRACVGRTISGRRSSKPTWTTTTHCGSSSAKAIAGSVVRLEQPTRGNRATRDDAARDRDAGPGGGRGIAVELRSLSTDRPLRDALTSLSHRRAR